MDKEIEKEFKEVYRRIQSLAEVQGKTITLLNDLKDIIKK